MSTKSKITETIELFSRRTVYWALQPILILISLYLAHIEASIDTHTLFVIFVIGLITFLEAVIPGRAEWRKRVGEIFSLLGFVVLAGVTYIVIETIYSVSLFEWMSALQNLWGLDVWPSHWPTLVQVLLVFLAYEFVNYWYHRAAHRWGWLWKLSGHGAHHAFKKLSGLNATANHPIEAVFLILPRAIVGFLLGGEAVGAAIISLATITSILAHSNLSLNSAVVGWLFTTNRYHIHHHSQVISESNTNFGCMCIVWDRVFGTFQDSDTKHTGISDTQPSYKALLMMPFKR